jgi:hypothetical protein
MDFANRLAKVFKKTIDPASVVSGVQKWNSEIETFLAAPPSTTAEDTKEESSETTVSEVADELHKRIVAAILHIHHDECEKIDEVTKAATDKYRQTPPSPCPESLFELIRAAKNILRWHIQIFLERKGTVLPSPAATLQSPAILELLVCILEQHALNEESLQQDLSRNISLYLFYATYITLPGDEVTQKALHHVMVKLQLPELSLRILTRPCTAALALSLIRNLHNAIITLQGASKTILAIQIDWDVASAPFRHPAPWAPSEKKTIDFQSTCVNILLWALSSDPPFPGKEDDKRGELASEILGAFYAVRAGQQLVPGVCDEKLMETVVNILKLSNDVDQDKRVTQCKLSTVSLLMDSDRTFGEYILQKKGFPDLLNLFEAQVSDILNNTRVDNSATAALVPILVALNKYASANSEIHKLTKTFVFPEDAEPAFREKALEQQKRELSSTEKQKKNMGPLDAPAGTFRRMLCTLLTWPEGHIKRCTGELLWTLSSCEPTEYVHRVGFGNALPLLSLKGFAKMPFPQS